MNVNRELDKPDIGSTVDTSMPSDTIYRMFTQPSQIISILITTPNQR